MDATAYTTLLVGFALGLKHATEADHVAAVSTILSETAAGPGSRGRAARVGLSWGLGHLLTLFAAGTILILLRVRMSRPVEWALEFVVALVLIWLGMRTVRRCFTGRYHFHRHRHGPLEHAHLHFHAHSEAGHGHDAHAGLGAVAPPRSAIPLLVGMAHGLAGTAGLALLVLGSISSRIVGVLYLLVFGFGALCGMAAFSAALSVPLSREESRLTWLNSLRLIAGGGSFILGMVLVYRAFLPASWPF